MVCGRTGALMTATVVSGGVDGVAYRDPRPKFTFTDTRLNNGCGSSSPPRLRDISVALKARRGCKRLYESMDAESPSPNMFVPIAFRD